MKLKRDFPFFVFFLTLYEITTYLSNDMYLPSMPLLQLFFHVPEKMLQYTLVAWFLGSASLQLILGPLSDRFGRKPILFIGGAFFVLANILSAMTAHFTFFLIMRFFQGAAVCSVVVAGYATIHESFEQKRAVHLLTIMTSVTILAPVFGPLLGSVLLWRNEWRIIFIVLAIFAGIALSVLFVVMPETNPNGKQLHPFEIRSILKQYKRIFLNLRFLVHTLSFCFIFAGLIAWVAASPFLLMKVLHYSVFSYGWIQFLVFSFFVIGGRLVRQLLIRKNIESLLRIGYLIVYGAVSSFIIGALIFPRSLPFAMVCLMAYAFGCGMLFAPSQRLAIDSCKEAMGLRIAVFFSAMGMFCTLGSVLVAFLYQNTVLSLAMIIVALTFSSLIFRAGELKAFIVNKSRGVLL